MNDNYLWDRKGEPDVDVQELEELLGTLRYQPRPFQVPPSIRIGARRAYAPLAIAAAVALLTLGAGIWVRIRTAHSVTPVQATNNPAVRQLAPIAPSLTTSTQANVPTGEGSRTNAVRRSLHVTVAIHRQPARREETQLTAEELSQKEQVITALRLVSAKLNLAQRKSQGLPPVNNIRNQHKIG